jgi:ribulose-5-phosphate 4-epimerase/fuculose-1-phosphate aldolase
MTPKLNTVAEARRDLAAILRWSSRLGLSEGICNHYSIALGADRFLVNPFGYHWSELKASQMLLMSHDGAVIDGEGTVEPTAMFIHSQTHRRLPEATCVLHTHMPFATALAALDRCRLEMVSQNALRFFDDVAYDDDYQGLALDAAEGIRICSKLGDKRVLFLANHGVVVIGRSIASAFDDMYYLERACQIQVLAQSTGQPLKHVPDEVCRRTSEQFKSDDSYAQAHLAAIRRLLDRESPEYAQ